MANTDQISDRQRVHLELDQLIDQFISPSVSPSKNQKVILLEEQGFDIKISATKKRKPFNPEFSLQLRISEERKRVLIEITGKERLEVIKRINSQRYDLDSLERIFYFLIGFRTYNLTNFKYYILHKIIGLSGRQIMEALDLDCSLRYVYSEVRKVKDILERYHEIERDEIETVEPQQGV